MSNKEFTLMEKIVVYSWSHLFVLANIFFTIFFSKRKLNNTIFINWQYVSDRKSVV